MLGNMDKILESVSLEAQKRQEAITENTVVLSETVAIAINECIEHDTLESFMESVLYETSIPVIEAKAKEADDEDEDEDKKDKEDSDDDDEECKEDDEDCKKKKKGDSDDDDEESLEEGKKKKACKESFIIGESSNLDDLDIDAIIKEADESAKEEPKAKGKIRMGAEKVWETIVKGWNHIMAVFNKGIESLCDAILTVFNGADKISAQASEVNKGLGLIKNVAVKTTSFENAKPEKLGTSVFEIFWKKMTELVSAKGGKLVGLGALNGFTPEIDKLGDIGMAELIKEATAHTLKTFTGTEATAVEGAFSAYFRGRAVANVGEFMQSNDVVANCDNSKVKQQITGANKVLDIIRRNAKIQGNGAIKNASADQVIIIKKIDMITRQAADLEMKKNIAFLQAVKARTVNSFNIAAVALKAAGKSRKTSAGGITESTDSGNGDVISKAINDLFA